jgi:hypothetical protein
MTSARPPSFARLAVLVLLALGAASCGGREESGPRWEPQAGTTLRTRVQQQTSQELVRLEIAIDGETLPPESVGAIEEVHAGRARRFARRFTELAREDVSTSSGPQGEVTQATTFSSPFQDRQVGFVWNPRERRHETVGVVGDEGVSLASEHLEGLQPVLDLSAFLPAAGGQPGDEWPVAPRALAQILQPGGDLGWVSNEEGRALPLDARSFAKNLQGIIHASYLEPEEDSEPGLARIGLSIRADSRFERDLPPAPDAPGPSTHSSVEIGYRLRGELRWDLEAGHAHDLSLSGKVFAQSTQTVLSGNGDDVFEQTDRLRFEGTTSIQVDVEAVTDSPVDESEAAQDAG